MTEAAALPAVWLGAPRHSTIPGSEVILLLCLHYTYTDWFRGFDFPSKNKQSNKQNTPCEPTLMTGVP